MAGIVHHQGAVFNLFLQEALHLGIGIALGGADAGIGIPHDLAHLHLRIGGLHLVANVVGILHVLVLIAVVAHHANHVLPCAGMAVLHVGDALVHHDGSLRGRGHGKASNAQIGLVAQQVPSLAVIEQAEIVFHDVASGIAHAVLALEAQQIVIGIGGSPCRAEHAVVPCAVAHENEVSGGLVLAGGAVVEHLHEAAVGRGVGRSAGEFVIDLVGTHHNGAKPVVCGMGIGQTLGLGGEFSARGHNDDHIQAVQGMEILVLHRSPCRGLGEGCV